VGELERSIWCRRRGGCMAALAILVGYQDAGVVPRLVRNPEAMIDHARDADQAG
jgi:hypothetical protein